MVCAAGDVVTKRMGSAARTGREAQQPVVAGRGATARVDAVAPSTGVQTERATSKAAQHREWLQATAGTQEIHFRRRDLAGRQGRKTENAAEQRRKGLPGNPHPDLLEVRAEGDAGRRRRYGQ